MVGSKTNYFGSLSDVIDPYGRQARLYPALIAIFPVALLIVAWFPALWTTFGILISLATSFGLVLLLSQLGRDRGKRCEPLLHQSWGGKPSVVLLHHADTRIDDHTKSRYRAFISRSLPGLALPTPAEEGADPTKADKAYESVTAWLLTQTRDTKRFSILFKENIAYGFRRNLWGLKPMGLTISLLGAVISTGLVAFGYISIGRIPVPEIVIATAAVWALSLIWVFIVTPAWVRLPADAYGMQLLAACDTLALPTSKPATGRKTSRPGKSVTN
jgi:hypothetical protein